MGETQAGIDFELQALYYLDSKDRQVINNVTGLKQPLSNFTVNTLSQISGISYFSFIEFDFQFYTYNVLAGQNDLITITDTGGTYTVQIPETYYATIGDLVSAVGTAFGADYTVSYDSATGHITILRIDTTNFSFKSGSPTPALITQMMGFNMTLMTGSNSYTSFNGPSLDYTKYIDICSNNLTKYFQPSQTSSMTRANIIKRIPLSGISFGAYERETSRTLPKYKFNPDENLGFIDIQLYDEWGFPFNPYQEFTLRFILFKPLFNKKIDEHRYY